MKTQLFSNPLSRPFECWLDLLEDIHGDFKTWLKTLGAGRYMTDRQFEALKFCIEGLSRSAGTVKEQKAGLLFGGSRALRCFDEEKLEEERLNSIPSLFFGEYGTFHHYVDRILPAIKEHAQTHPAFKAKYTEAKKNAVKNSSIAGRTAIYLHASRSYPPPLIAELEGIDESRLVPELLPFLYWGKGVYLTMYRLDKGGDTDKDLYRSVPRWNHGSHSWILFIGYAAMKRDMHIPEAVFEGMEGIEIMRILARLFHTGSYRDEYRLFPNWLDKAIIGDFYREKPGIYRECEGLHIAPGEAEQAGLFLEYGMRLLGQTAHGADLPMLQMFFPGADPEEDRGILWYLDCIADDENNEKAYWPLIKAIADKAALYPAAELLPLERFKTYRRGNIEKSAFYLFERYLSAIKPDRENLILLGSYICVLFENQRIDMFENQRIDMLSQLLWLFNYTRLADYCEPFIDGDGFLRDLLAAAGVIETCSVTALNWINYVVTVRLLLTYRDRTPHPVWPVRIGDAIEKQFEGADGENPIHTAAALLLSETEIKADPVLLEGIWDLFFREKVKGSVDLRAGFIPYLYFIRAGDEDKVEAMLGKARPEYMDEALVLRYLRVNKKFDFNDFFLRLDDIDTIELLPPEVFPRYRTTWDKAVLRYLERHGDTFEKVNRIAAHYKGSETADIILCITRAAEEMEPEYLRLYILLALYFEERGGIDKALDKDPGQTGIILERCKRQLALLRKIPGTITDDERRHRYLGAFYAACFLARRKSCWEGLKPLVLAFRRADKPLLEANLRPAGWIEENIAAQIGRFLRWKWGDEKMKALRRDMAEDLSDRIKPRKNGKEGAAGLQNRGQDYSSYEQGLEGFALDRVEPNPLWRYAYVRALGDLAVDGDGSGRPFHRILLKAAEDDPSPQVRKQAGQTAKQLRRIRNGCEEGAHNRRLIQAFWWIRRAHMLTLESPIDETEALRTRNTEHR
jgi:hypothetical protein